MDITAMHVLQDRNSRSWRIRVFRLKSPEDYWVAFFAFLATIQAAVVIWAVIKITLWVTSLK